MDVISLAEPTKPTNIAVRPAVSNNSFAISTNGKRVAVADSSNKQVVVWDADKNQLIDQWPVDTSAAQTVAGRRRDFDVIVIGGGTFGSVVAEHLLVTDRTRSRRILVLEAGPFVLPEHVQNLPFMGGAPDLRVPWVNHPALNYSGLIFAVGGRSLTWGGWSPELLDEEMAAWPPTV